VFLILLNFIWYQSTHDPQDIMGEITETSNTALAKVNEGGGGGSSSLKCPMLNSINYTVWSMKMSILLQVHKVWDIIEEPSDNNEKNVMAIALLFQSIPESLTLQSKHLGAERVKEARLQTLMAEFDRIKMKDNETIDEFPGRLSEISSKSASLGETIEEPKLVKKFLKSLPRKKYIHIVAALKQVLDLKKTSFEDITGRLKVYEERITDEEEVQDDQGKLKYANSDSHTSHEQGSEYRGRGRGGRSYGRGRGQGRYNEGRDTSRVVCYRCDKTGHYALDCPDRLLKLQETQEDEAKSTAEADELMIHEVVYLNEEKVVPSKFDASNGGDNIWYLDKGASNHMTGNRSYFTSLDQSITGKVRFDDDSRIDIKGKGMIEFIDRNGEQRKMVDVYFIPELKSNIISLGQATKAGCDVRMKGEDLTMHDRDGKLLVKAVRSKNRLYKVSMGIKDTMCLYSTTPIDSSRWHARLVHINHETMKSMVKGELVVEITLANFESNVCGSCLLGKQTRQVFPQATMFRATKALELSHGDLCGPITPNTLAGNKYVFVLIDDFTRYMWTIMLKEKNETFGKFKKFKSSVEQVLNFKTEMALKFEMSDLGRVTYYLGIEVCQNKEGITLSQRRYALKILEEAGMAECNLVHTPMEAGLNLSKAPKEKDIDATSDRRNVGCLRYLLHTRPDLSFCVGVLRRYMQSPKESHGAAMKQCLRYLRGTTTLGLEFRS